MWSYFEQNTEKNAKTKIAEALNIEVNLSSIEDEIRCHVDDYNYYTVFFNEKTVFFACTYDGEIRCYDVSKKIEEKYNTWRYEVRATTNADKVVLDNIKKINGGACKINAVLILPATVALSFLFYAISIELISNSQKKDKTETQKI